MILFDGEAEITTTLKRALSEIDPSWKELPGLIIPGSHTPTRINEKLCAIQAARENDIPTLLICFGHQLGAIEYARNLKGVVDATSEEWGEGTFVVVKRPEGLNVGQKDGETYWNNYQVDFDWQPAKNIISVQYHPEFQSSIDKPHPILTRFLTMCKHYDRE